MIQALRGMKDVLEESEKFTRVVSVAKELAQRAGHSYIQTPVLEETKLFLRSVGNSSDIVNKEMYNFTDKGGNEVCLRPEGTAGVARAFVERKLDRINSQNRFFYYGAMFRYERPQKGRFRQFNQFGCESFGEPSMYEDARLIHLAAKIFTTLGISYRLEINSLGCPTCMGAYKKKLVEFLSAHEHEICDACKIRKATNPIRALDCKEESCQKVYESAPKIADNLCPACQSDFDKLQALLRALDLGFTINKNLVRGLDYYNKTAFEFVCAGLGAQNAIAGGGRYDALIETLGGKPTPAVGFAFGIERILDLITDAANEKIGVYFGALSEQALEQAFVLSQTCKAKNYLDTSPKSLRNHLKNADKKGFKYCAVIGEDELKTNKVWIKNMQTNDETTLDQDKLGSYVD